MKLTKAIIDKRTLGKTQLLVDVMPYYLYADGVKTNNIAGYRYKLVIPDQEFDTIYVKIPGVKQIDKPEGSIEVILEGLELFLYWMSGTYNIGATATGIKAKS